MRWERGASPAAAAGVSRALTQAGVRRATEIAKGQETEGFAAMPKGDHVRVEYVPSPFATEEAQEAGVTAGLVRCEAVLSERGYAVERAVAPIAHPGEWRDGPVLMVRPRDDDEGTQA